MLAPDLGPAIFAAIAILFYNAIMSCVFMSQRYHLRKISFSKRLPFVVATFFSAILLQLFTFLLGPDSEIWPFSYSIAITLLVLIDRIVKHRRRKSLVSDVN